MSDVDDEAILEEKAVEAFSKKWPEAIYSSMSRRQDAVRAVLGAVGYYALRDERDRLLRLVDLTNQAKNQVPPPPPPSQADREAIGYIEQKQRGELPDSQDYPAIEMVVVRALRSGRLHVARLNPADVVPQRSGHENPRVVSLELVAAVCGVKLRGQVVVMRFGKVNCRECRTRSGISEAWTSANE